MSPTADYDLGTARGTIEIDASSLGRASAAFTTLGRGLLGFSAVTVGAFVYAAKSAADFERQMSAVAAVSQATGGEMDLLKQKALDLGSSTLYSADEVGRAMEQLAKAGIPVADILNGATDAVVMLAQAAGDELAGGVDAAAEVMANALKIFGGGADDAMHFADVLVSAAASSTLSVDDIANSLRYAGPVAASLGLSIDDLSTALAILGDRGIRGSTAGTSLRGVFLGLATQTPKATKVLKELGIITEDGTNRFFDMNGAMKPLPEVMQILGDATKNLSEEQKLQAFNTIFQRRAMNAAMILAEQGATGFNKYAAAIAALDAENIAAKKLDNLSGDMTILKNSVNALIIQTGMQFQDMLRGWVQGLTGVVQWLRDLDPKIGATILKIGAFVGVIAGALGVVSLMIGLGIRMYRTFKDLAAGVRLVVGGFRLLSASLLTNPLFLFIAALVAIGAAAYIAYQRSETFRNAVNGAFEDIKAVVLPIIDTLKQGFQAMIDAFQFGGTGADGFIGVMEKIGVAARAVYDFFTNDFVPGIVAFFDALAGGTSDAGGFVGFMAEAGAVVREFADWMINVGVPAVVEFARVVGEMGFDALVATISFLTEEVFPRVVDAVQETSERVVSAFNWINDNVVPVFTAFGQLIAAVIDRVIAIVRFFAPVFQGIFSLLSAGFGNLVTIISAALSVILNIWNLFKDNLWNAVLIAWDFIQGIIESALKIIQGIIQIVTGIISGDWGRVWEGIKNILAGVWEGIKEIVTTAIDLVGLAIQSGLDIIHAIWDTTWTAMSVVLRTIWNTITTIITTFWNTIKGMFSNALGLIKGIWDSTLGALFAKANEIFTQVATIVAAKISEVVGFFTGLAGKIVAAMVTLGQQLYDFFFAAVGRARNAVELAASGIISFVMGIPGRIISALGDVGSLLYNAGKAIINGLLNGIKAAFESVKNFVGGIAGTIAGLKGPMQYDKKLLIPAGGWIMGGLMEGMKAQMPALEKMVSSIAPTIQTQFAASTGVTTPTGVTNNHTTDASVSIGEVIIPVKDLEELKTVQEFFNRVGQVARQGVAA